jgi:hypothetical protein
MSEVFDVLYSANTTIQSAITTPAASLTEEGMAPSPIVLGPLVSGVLAPVEDPDVCTRSFDLASFLDFPPIDAILNCTHLHGSLSVSSSVLESDLNTV